MDKELINRQIILMRKIVRTAKRYVYQKIWRQINKLKTKLNKCVEENTASKINRKIKNKQKELFAVKRANIDEVSKRALINTQRIESNTSNDDEKAMVRIANCDIVRENVIQFKEENPNCDQWLPSLIELWQQKRILKKEKLFKSKKDLSQLKANNDITTPAAMPESHINNDSPQLLIPNRSQTLKTSSKSKKVKQINKRNLKDVKNVWSIENNEKIETLTEKSEDKQQIHSTQDEFFLNVSTNNSQENSHIKNYEKDKQLLSNKFMKTSNSAINKDRDRSKWKQTKIEEQRVRRVNNCNKFEVNDTPENIHPSWEAKRLFNEKNKINIDQIPKAKKITFK